MQAVILAGGLGTRLRPITKRMPKAMAKVKNKPFLEHLIKMLKDKGIDKAVICVGYLCGQVMDYFGDGKKFGININYSIEKNLMGTAGAILLSRKYLEDDFFVINGDTYMDLDYTKVMKSHKKAGKMGTMVIYGNKNNAFAKNNVKINKAGEIIKYDKECQNGKMRYADAGVAVFQKSLVSIIPRNKKATLEHDIFPKLIKMSQLHCFKSNRKFYDIGTIQRLKAFNEALL